jgi:hypothetical protein
MTPTKRTRGTAIRNGNATATTTPTSSQDEAEYGEDGDGDVYVPSRSASPGEVSASDYSDSGSLKRRVANKGKDKVPTSAAEALAQMVARYPSGGGMGVGNRSGMGGGIGRDDNGPWQAGPLDASASTSSTARGRKNGTISLPVPVPHLTKKSRGRKVPYVDVRAARGSTSAGGEDGDSDGAREGEKGMSSRGGRGGRGNASGSGGRTFVCEVPGCGKCFVRGEHLKRHVRSIHTHDKRESLFLPLTVSLTLFNKPIRVLMKVATSRSVVAITLVNMFVCIWRARVEGDGFPLGQILGIMYQSGFDLGSAFCIPLTISTSFLFTSTNPSTSNRIQIVQ